MNVAGNLSLGHPKIRATPTRDWAAAAACRGHDPNLWFLDDPGGSYQTARRICAGCEVRAECLDWAIATHTNYGLWGGLAPHERRPLRRRRPPPDPQAIVADRRFLHSPCPRCGHGPFAWHKWCPACRGPRPDPEAGHLGTLEQYLWVVFLLLFFVLLVRLLVTF